MTCWSKHLQDSQVVVCTDNEGVKDSLIACQTSSYNATPILVALLQLEFEVERLVQQSSFGVKHS